ncbi:MAG TPA: histidine kinase dimerization/phospho-acceptor domain-containing protein, partial [Burkholderiales bacterium]|nr:histidine kinase dimerization/phospho-acceptor domain-containing protein [Burkholderiales bacterium]
MNPSTTANGTADSLEVSTKAVEAEIRDRSDPQHVLADRVAQLYRQMPIAIGATFIAGAIATFELQGRWLKELVLIWWAVVVTFSAAASLLLYAYYRSADKVASARDWLRWLAIAALGNGASWGLAGGVFFRSLSDEQQVFLAFLFAGMASVGIPVYAASWPIFALYAAGILLPFFYVLLTFGNRLFVEIALLVPLFYAINVVIAYRLTRVFESGYRLRRAYEEARRQVEASGRKLALFAERAPIAVLELRPDGTVSEVNHAAEMLFGYAAAELIGGSVKKLVRAEFHAEFDRAWQELLSTRESMSGLKIRNPRRDGIDLICDWTVTPLVNFRQEVIAVIAQGRDVTAQLEAERMKKEFTSTLSHELRTPLTSIIGSLQLINSGVMGEVEREVGELTEVAERNGQRLLDLINDILDIEKIESGKLALAPELIPVDALVEEAIVLNKAFAERFNVRFDWRGDPQRKLFADRKRLLQVMTNLLSNAAKFSPDGGVVEITTEDAGAKVRLAISDRGGGIPEGFRGRIFGRFTQADSTATRQKGGSGL